jgi:HEAT repeat protein
LIRLTLFSEADFFHLVSFIEESTDEEETEKARQLALHYCRGYISSLQMAPDLIRMEWLARVPDLIDAAASLRCLELVSIMANGLRKELADRSSNWDYHIGVVSLLPAISKAAARFEDYETALQIGLDLEGFLSHDSVRHAGCCGKTLGNLLSPPSVETLITLSSQRNDAQMAKTILPLLKLAAVQVADVALELLEKEADISKRIRILRLTGRLGPRAIEAVRSKLTDERWYMVRNACTVLASLGDPGLPSQLEPVLSHSDHRVQQAAVTAISKQKSPEVGEVLARSLPKLPTHLQETVLDELILLREPAAVALLEEFAFSEPEIRVGTIQKVIQVLIRTADDASVRMLARVVMHKGFPPPVRKSALAGLRGIQSSEAEQLVSEFSQMSRTQGLL